tara:strand:- start:1019 stop:1192 length:174 start_codon:yes stop_codon:yes gene_type:complete
MDKENKGLTVGELTMAVAGVIIVFLIWSNIRNRDIQKESQAYIFDYSFVEKISSNSF